MRLSPPTPARCLAWVILLAGCGAAPPPPPPPTPPPADAAGRAAACGERLRPDDEAAHACYRDAMMRLRRLPEAVERLAADRRAHPEDERRWYLEVRARLLGDPRGAVEVARLCLERLPDAPWCGLALGLAQERGSDLASALAQVSQVVPRLDEAPALAALARLRLSAGQGKEAVDLVRRALGRDPASADVQVAAAWSALVEGDRLRAEAHIARALEAGPDGAGGLIARARLHLLVGDGPRASADLRAALAADPDHDPARETLADLLLEQGERGAALEHLNVLIDRQPRRGDLMVKLGMALLGLGNAERALGWADLALGLQPDDVEALGLRLRALIASGDHAAATKMRDRVFTGRQAARQQVLAARAWAAAGQGGRAESEFADAAARHREDAAVWRAYADWYHRTGRLGRAATILRKGIEAVPGDAGLHADLAAIFEEGEHPDQARSAMAEAARLAPEEPDHQDELARLEFLSRHVDEAIVRWESLLVRHPRADRARLRLSQAYRALRRYDEASEELRALLGWHPGDSALLGTLGQVLLEGSRPAKAIPVLRDALGRGGDSRTLKPLLASALAATGAHAEAQQTYEAALREDPANRALRLTYGRFLEVTADPEAAARVYRSQLARDPEDADAQARLTVLGLPGGAPRWPAAEGDPALAPLAARAPAAPEQGATVLRDEHHVVVDGAGLASIRHVRTVLLQDAAAVERHATAILGFDAGHAPTILRARTLTPDGEDVPVGPEAQEIANPHAGTALHGDMRQLILRFPRVEPGAIVDYEVVTHRPNPELKGIWWDGYVLGNLEPTVAARYSLDLPADEPLKLGTTGLPAAAETRADGRRRLAWAVADLPGYTLTARERLPAVFVSNLKAWSAVDAWYHGLFADRARPTEALTEKARALTADAPDARARVAAIYRFVERSVAYLGIEFGIGAYQPRPAATTLATHKGDCKDMTALMVALLGGLGIEAHAALVRPRGQAPFMAEHVSPGQFSHVLLHVPAGDLWLDATAGLGTLDAIPDALRGQTALIVDGKGGRLVDIPEGTAAASTIRQRDVFTLNPTGGGTLESALTLTGDPAGTARQRLLPLDAGGRDALLASPGYLLPDGRIPAAVSATGLDDPGVPLVLTARHPSPDLVALRVDGALVVSHDLRFFTDGPLPALGSEGWLAAPRTLEQRVVLVPPAGYRFEWAPLKANVKIADARLTVSEQRGAGRTEITARLVLPRGPRDAAAHQRLLAQLRHEVVALGQPLRMVPGPGFDAVAFLGAVVEERPDDPRLLANLGRALLDQDRPVEALPVLQRAEGLEPSDPAVQALLAAAYLALDNTRAAAAPLRALIARGDAEAPVYGMLATVLLRDGEAVAAIDVLEAGLARFPTDEPLQRAHILALGRGGQGARAVEAAERFAAREPDDASRHTLLGDVASEVGRPDVAERAYRRALALTPDDGRALNNLAWMLRGRPSARDEALALAKRAVAQEPLSDASWDTLAEVHFLLGDVAAAVAAIDRAIALNPRRADQYRARRARYLQGP
ncbi:MAG: tetratricopeptide repeat protein [Myxococcales bacterium]|nr:tetratricopeptide repeat protein [Myxococcales bacterium]